MVHTQSDLCRIAQPSFAGKPVGGTVELDHPPPHDPHVFTCLPRISVFAGEEETDRRWKNPAFAIPLRDERVALRKRRVTQLPGRAASRPAGGFDAADFQVPAGGWEHFTDSLGDWESHKAEEQLQRRRAGCHGHSRVPPKGGRAEFSFPRDDGPFGWLDIARGGGAPEQQLQKAMAMVKRDLPAKAKRQAYCGILGARYSCVSFEPGRPSGHRFYRRYGCKNRYCLRCGPAGFRALFAKYVGLRDVAARLVPHWPCLGRRPERVIAKIDFTTKKLGRMPNRDEVREFNRAIKRFFRLVEQRFSIGREAYGALWCDEFGGQNANLHAHAMYAGPWLSNQGLHKNELSEIWGLACRRTAFAGSFIVSIKPAKSFEAGLAHALKYAGKFLSHDPERLADLEQTFHGVKRVHTVAGFYNALPREDSAQEAEAGFSCPLCGAVLVRVGPMSLIGVLEAQGYADLEAASRAVGKERAFGPARASPP